MLFHLYPSLLIQSGSDRKDRPPSLSFSSEAAFSIIGRRFFISTPLLPGRNATSLSSTLRSSGGASERISVGKLLCHGMSDPIASAAVFQKKFMLEPEREHSSTAAAILLLDRFSRPIRKAGDVIYSSFVPLDLSFLIRGMLKSGLSAITTLSGPPPSLCPPCH